MAGRNDFLVFNEDQENILDQTEYENHAQRLVGVRGGIADSRLHNKLYRQLSAMTAALGEIIKNKDMVASDDDIPSLVQNLQNALVSSEAVYLSYDNSTTGLNAINVQAAIDEHIIADKPHRFTDNGVVYRWGLAVKNGVPIMDYEEVV